MKALAIIATLIIMLSAAAAADVPKTMTYQGILTDNGGVPVADNNYTITFRIYDEVGQGSLVWEETSIVPVFGGVFTVVLGESTPLDFDFDQPYFIALSVGGGAELVPRTPLTSTPYSLGTGSLPDSIVTPEKIGGGTVVRSLNGLHDDVVVRTEGGATLTVQGDTLVITAAAGGASNTPWQPDGNNIFYNNGRVGVGVSSPLTGFHVGEGGRMLAGADTTGGGNRMIWFGEKGAFRAGGVESLEGGSWDAALSGDQSFAAGLSTRATGLASVAVGRRAEALADYATATGYFTKADALYSTAMGLLSEARGEGSFALGNRALAVSNSSFVIGRYNRGFGSGTTWVPSDPILEIGIGSGPADRQNAVTVLKNGNVGIGTTLPLDLLHILDGRLRVGSVETIEDVGVSELGFDATLRPITDDENDLGEPSFRWRDVYATNGTINTSDARVKTAVEDSPYGLDEVMQMRPVRYEWIDRPQAGKKLGLIAQDLLPVVSEVVKTHAQRPVSEEDAEQALASGRRPQMERVEMERMGVYYSDLIPVLIKAIQEQQATIEALQMRVEELEGR